MNYRITYIPIRTLHARNRAIEPRRVFSIQSSRTARPARHDVAGRCGGDGHGRGLRGDGDERRRTCSQARPSNLISKI
eukprot:1936978-Pleurochrysis_carterae.AAC.5